MSMANRLSTIVHLLQHAMTVECERGIVTDTGWRSAAGGRQVQAYRHLLVVAGFPRPVSLEVLVSTRRARCDTL